MSAQDTTTGNGAAPTGPSFTVEKLYIKDVSFEAPGTPQVFNEQGQPQLQMNLNQRVQRLTDERLRSRARRDPDLHLGDKTAYLAEVQQAGVFGLVGFRRHDAGSDARHPLPERAVSLRAPDRQRPDPARAASRRSCCSRSTSKRCTPKACASVPRRAATAWPAPKPIGNA